MKKINKNTRKISSYDRSEYNFHESQNFKIKRLSTPIKFILKIPKSTSHLLEPKTM